MRVVNIDDSSQIGRIAHDGIESMEVYFLNGAIYKYHQVPLPLFGLIVGSPSVGAMFNHVKSGLTVYEKLAG